MNLFKVCPGSCAHACFSLWLTRLYGGLHYLFFACQRDPSRGRPARWLLLPFVSYQEWLGRIFAHYYLFLQVVSQHLGYLLLMASHPCPTWTFIRGIRSDLEGNFLFGCFRYFQRNLRCGQEIFLNASAQAAVSFPSDLFGDFRSCLWV